MCEETDLSPCFACKQVSLFRLCNDEITCYKCKCLPAEFPKQVFLCIPQLSQSFVWLCHNLLGEVLQARFSEQVGAAAATGKKSKNDNEATHCVGARLDHCCKYIMQNTNLIFFFPFCTFCDELAICARCHPAFAV